MGLRFANRVGLAAGFDKNAVAIDGLFALGFGHVEVGTVTPRAQGGNPQPRLFRVPGRSALINRMGFPNEGADAVVARIRARRSTGILGVNIGKNATTPVERAVDDYLACLRTVYAVSDYITVNVSSPNTVGLRSLQATQYLGPLLGALLEEAHRLGMAQSRTVPLLVKLAPDLADDELRGTLPSMVRALPLGGVIANKHNSLACRVGNASTWRRGGWCERRSLAGRERCRSCARYARSWGGNDIGRCRWRDVRSRRAGNACGGRRSHQVYNRPDLPGPRARQGVGRGLEVVVLCQRPLHVLAHQLR